MLAVTFSGGDKMMRSIVSTDRAHASPALQLGQLCPFWWPRGWWFLCGAGNGCAFYPVLCKSCSEGGSCVSLFPVSSLPVGL